MDALKQDSRRDVVMVDIDTLMPENHLLRKIERVMDYDWLYQRLSPYYCHDIGRNGTDPVDSEKDIGRRQSAHSALH